MQEEKKLTKKELKLLRRLGQEEQAKTTQKRNTTQWIIIATSVLLFLSFFSFVLYLTKQEKKTQPKQTTTLNQTGWVRGNASASATLLEFSDFQCPACKLYEGLIQQLLSAEGENVKFVYKHFPLSSIHKNALPAAVAAEAAGKQNKFWEMHDLLFEKQEEWAKAPNAKETFIEYAKTLKLDEETFRKDLEDKTLLELIQAQQEEGITLGINGTPTFFVNGTRINNPATFEEFKKRVLAPL